MGMIFHIIGKSSTGKDTIYNIIKNDGELNLKPIVLYTTRPIRDGEADGATYHFVDDAEYERLNNKGVIIEARVYHTVHGDWRYFSVDDGTIDLDKESYIVIGTLESYMAYTSYFGSKVVPIYIEVDDGERLSRALIRERLPENHKYKEMCRRFLADEDDFSDDKLNAAKLSDDCRFVNDDLDECVLKIKTYIRSRM